MNSETKKTIKITKDFIPSLKANVLVRPMSEDSVMVLAVFEREALYKVSGPAATFMKKINSKDTIQEITENLARQLVVDEQVVQKEAIKFVKDLHKFGLIEKSE